MMKWSFAAQVLSAVTALAVAHSNFNAQCLAPDGLGGPCCAPVIDTLPAFPTFTNPGSAIRWDACSVSAEVDATLVIDAPTATFDCAIYTATISVIDTSGSILASGALELYYSRTWEEEDPAGDRHQVWRFLAMGDLTVLPGGGIVPIDGPTSFYQGYIDYAFECVSATYQQAVVLSHSCDAFLHAPGISAVPGAFNPTSSFAFVAPDTSAQPFIPALVPAIAGPVSRSSLRNSGGPICFAREPLQPTLNVLGTGCACPLSSTLPGQNAATSLSGFGACGGFAFSLDLTGTVFPWLHLVSTSIGRWTSTGSYPGTEGALVYEGPLWLRDSCAAQNYAELHYGAGSRGGWLRVPVPGVPPAPNMLDLRSNWSAVVPGPLPLPIIGLILPTPGMRHGIAIDVF